MLYRPKQDLAALVNDIAELKQQLSRVTDALARLAEGDRRVSLTIAEWCARHGLSESQYHKLRRVGRAPRALKIGNAGLRISIEADREWVKAREAEAEAEKQSPTQQIA
jgi:hypothetical protein